MIAPGGQEDFAPRVIPDTLRQTLAQAVDRVLLEEWGGPRNPLAVQHIREQVIPDILHCIQTNLTLVENPTFINIFADKFANQFGYPQAYAQQLAGDVLKAIKANLPEEFLAQQDLHPWSPWEKVFRFFSLGVINPVIAGKTGYSEDYIQLLRKKYMDIARVGSNYSASGGHSCYEAENELCRFIADFRQRFTTDRFYLQKLEARQIVEDLGLKIDHLTLLDILLNCSRLEGQAGVREMAKLTGGRVKILRKLVKGGVLEVSGPEDCITLSGKSATLVGRLMAPEVVQTLLDVQNSPDGGCDQACAMLTRLNQEMVIAVLEEISACGLKPLGRILCALYHRVNKRLGLKIIKTLADLNFREGVPLLLECLTHNDSLVRATACRALGEIGDKAAAFALIKSLHDPVPMVKEKAIEAVGRLRITAVARHLQLIAANYKETPAVRRMAGKVAEELIGQNVEKN